VTPPRLRVAAVASALLVVAVAINAGASGRVVAPPPTPVPPHGSPSPFPTKLATPADTSTPPAIAAGAAVLADPDSGQILFAKDPRTRRPIASLTKLMTALLVRHDLPLHATVTVDPAAVFDRKTFGSSSVLGLKAGERVSVENLLYAMLLGSANDAADALAIAADGSEAAFVRHMNAEAARLGMRDTHFASASGLDDDGHSTPRDLLTLTDAVNADPVLRSITGTKVQRIPAPKGPDRVIQNRNVLLWLYPGAVGTKTGTTAGAGSCVIATARRDGRALVAIVLHAQDEPFSDAAALLNYGFGGWREETLVHAGDAAGEATIRGGTVPVVAATDLRALVPVADDARAEHLVPDPAAAYPPRPHARVATLVFVAGSAVLGRVPLLVSDVPPPPAATGPWWARTADAVSGAVADAIRAIAA
jgi:serine-type D-Ala-D-Ala carboxypeptidase (penicillin-binding protein 5/6)